MSSASRYYQLTKPGIIYGNLLAAGAGFFIASQRHMDVALFLETLAGIALVIASACVVNNYIDRDIDKIMARTKQRAFATNDITTINALIYAALLGLAGFAMLSIFANLLTVIIGLIGYVDYIVLYGFAKRHTWHGTLVGSVSGSMPLVAGYTSVTDNFDGGAVILLLIMTFWQMPHFYAIAIRRLDDYEAAHIPVLPAVKGVKATKQQIIVYVAAFTLAVASLFLFGYAGYLYLIAMGIYGLGWLRLGLRGFKSPNDRQWAKRMFLYSLAFLPLLFVVAPLDAWLG